MPKKVIIQSKITITFYVWFKFLWIRCWCEFWTLLHHSMTSLFNNLIRLIHHYFFQLARLDLCFSQEISQGGAKLEATHQLKLQFLIVQIVATASQIAVHLNILLQKRNVIWTETVNQLKMSTKTIVFAAKVLFLKQFLWW